LVCRKFSDGAWAEAEPLYERWRATWEMLWSADHLSVAIILNNTARLCADEGEYAKAKDRRHRSLAAWDKALPPASL
jgi:hypothetical protein